MEQLRPEDVSTIDFINMIRLITLIQMEKVLSCIIGSVHSLIHKTNALFLYTHDLGRFFSYYEMTLGQYSSMTQKTCGSIDETPSLWIQGRVGDYFLISREHSPSEASEVIRTTLHYPSQTSLFIHMVKADLSILRTIDRHCEVHQTYERPFLSTFLAKCATSLQYDPLNNPTILNEPSDTRYSHVRQFKQVIQTLPSLLPSELVGKNRRSSNTLRLTFQYMKEKGPYKVP